MTISEDHKPDALEEKKRIEESGGRVFACSYDDGTLGPARVWLADRDIPGLAMSRSLGDRLAHSVGVSAEPDLFHLVIKPEHKWLIFASDGLWEFMENDEVIAIVAKANDPKKAAELLVAASAERWMARESVVDDTTVIVIELKSRD